MVPEDTDGLGALLSLQQPELYSDGLLKSPLHQRIIVMDANAHHWGIDDGALGNPVWRHCTYYHILLLHSVLRSTPLVLVEVHVFSGTTHQDKNNKRLDT